MKKILLAIAVLLLNSCKNEVEEILTTDDKWFLNAIENNKVLFLGQGFRFKNNGTYLYYPFVKNINYMSEAIDIHNYSERKWLKENDSFFLGSKYDKNFSYKILKFNKDTLWLRNNENIFLLIKK